MKRSDQTKRRGSEIFFFLISDDDGCRFIVKKKKKKERVKICVYKIFEKTITGTKIRDTYILSTILSF